MSGPGDKPSQPIQGLPPGATVIGASTPPSSVPDARNDKWSAYEQGVEGLPPGAHVVTADDKWSQYEVTPSAPTTIGAQHDPTSFAGKAEELFHEFQNDVRYGTGNTMAGRILQAMGALGSYRGVSPGAADLMTSPATGSARALEGSAQWSQPGKRLQGVGNVIGGTLEAAQIPASFAAPEAGEAATNIGERLSPGARAVTRLSGLQGKVAEIWNTIKSAEASAKATAKAAFPDIQTNVVLQTSKGPKAIPFKDAQEMYSKLGQAIADQRRAVAGGAPRFQLERLVQHQSVLSNAMSDAASAEGRLQELNDARAGWKQFEDAFHNKGSAVKPLLDMKPDETARIVRHLQGTDKGARTLETLRAFGVDTSNIESLLGRDVKPLLRWPERFGGSSKTLLTQDVEDAGRLRAIGPDAYRRALMSRHIKQALLAGGGVAAASQAPKAVRKLFPQRVSVRFGAED